MARELLDESLSDIDANEASNDETELKINETFAKKFEHNKKREELQKLEDKIGKSSRKRKRSDNASSSASSEESSSDSENEDDAGELATIALDAEIMATLDAIRNKDPRVYDGKSTFYTAPEQTSVPEKEKQEKPLYLRDYHRENLLGGQSNGEEQEPPLSYALEQQKLKNDILGEINTIAEASDDEEDLLVAKQQPVLEPAEELDVINADKDPETFLSNFMVSRAWVPSEKSTYQPLESDDEEDDRRAEEYEEAYNFRFEDPAKSNEKLRTHARDMAVRYSVRRQDTNARQKKREAEKETKELRKQQRREERVRLKKLRVDHIEEKIKKIKQAAGLRAEDIQPEDWSRFVDDDWDDTRWELEMRTRFGDEYYAQQDEISGDDGQPRKKPKKPKFDDDIDINDIVTDFDAEEKQPQFVLSDDEPTLSRKERKKKEGEKKKEAKRERRIIEQMVDDQLRLELNDTLPDEPHAAAFRYRETSPQSFGLTSRDILLADDTQLNQFAGLKKLAAFRDPDRKNKDKKHLGKKARLRKWRLDTFGDEEGLQDSELVSLPASKNVADDSNEEIGGVSIRTNGKKKRRRGKKQKTA